MDEVFDYIPLIGSFYRGWKIGNFVISFFNSDDKTDATLAQMAQLINSAMEEESVERKLSIVDRVNKLSNSLNCQKKYQLAVGGYTLLMGEYIVAILYWENNLWNVEARKNLDDYFNTILKYCSQISDINITWFTENAELVKDVQSRTDNLLKQVRETKRAMRKHYIHVDKILHPWKYRLLWMIPLILLLLTGWAYICYFFL